jgi:hypothetical protein
LLTPVEAEMSSADIKLEKYWLSIKQDPPMAEIVRLINFLGRADLNEDDGSGWIYECQITYIYKNQIKKYK